MTSSAIRSSILRCGAIVLACLLASACKGRQEPVKPIAEQPLVSFVDY